MNSRHRPSNGSPDHNDDIVFLYATFPTRDLARAIGREAVEKKLCACINIFPEHESIYSWKGEIETSNEVAAILKTSKTKLKPLSVFVEERHSYETPCLAVLKPDHLNLAFANWVRESTLEK